MSELLTRLFSPFEDPTGLERPLIRDIARYQLEYGVDVGVLNGVLVLIVRCGISYGYHDSWFKTNYNAAKGKMYRTSYHVLYPTQSVVKQADQVWYDEQPVLDVIPRCMDAELQGDASDKQVGDAMWDMSELVLSRDGHRPIIYSRYKLIEKWWGDVVNRSGNHYCIKGRILLPTKVSVTLFCPYVGEAEVGEHFGRSFVEHLANFYGEHLAGNLRKNCRNNTASN